MTPGSGLRGELMRDPVIGPFVDETLEPPSPFRGKGPIHPVVLGQDPTVKRPASRHGIVMVLNLDRQGSLRGYLQRICEGLGMDLETDIYATNYANVFFKVPPATIHEPDILRLVGQHCITGLINELSAYPGVPVLVLGEPLLRQVVLAPASAKVREYWGFHHEWKRDRETPFGHLAPSENVLNRQVFPFPHQPSANKKFYAQRIERYLEYMKSECTT